MAKIIFDCIYTVPKEKNRQMEFMISSSIPEPAIYQNNFSIHEGQLVVVELIRWMLSKDMIIL